jgi:hypothetical protein
MPLFLQNYFYQTARRHLPKDRNLAIHSRESLKSLRQTHNYHYQARGIIITQDGHDQYYSTFPSFPHNYLGWMDILLVTTKLNNIGLVSYCSHWQRPHWEWPSNKASSTLPGLNVETTPIGRLFDQWQTWHSGVPGDRGTQPCCYVATCTIALTSK